MHQPHKKILSLLKKHYPNSKCALNYKNPFELLVATMLSAQCTDERVNIVTEKLFKKYKTPRDYANADIKEFEKDIYSTGFYKNKAKNIVSTARIINNIYKGRVPEDFDQLLELPGVARKTANCVMGNAFNIPSGVVVDTHVLRITRRLGLTKNTDPNKIEQDLIKLLPKNEWINFSHMLIRHGRKICNSRKPGCEICFLSPVCPKLL
ncbi:MAG: endonuclease III [Candidatus Melainabacteria bacterium RIFCSPLOWO2_02_FULL_35_15]|nr:MAG: endonuclease III [Candidatus Melainabacteria bacterium RIFCSPLOWO2_12_FULL_35_11]OGI13503.1 MAG: endonuclease III [Candidatus Melainabacteria bacterium RIFCSPLOWO2_02_FULL_35_15]